MFSKTSKILPTDMSDVCQLVDSLQDRQKIMLGYVGSNGSDSIHLKKLKVLFQLTTDFSKALLPFYKIKYNQSKLTDVEAFIILADILIAIYNMSMNDLNILATQRDYKSRILSTGLTVGGSITGFAVLGPVGAFAGLLTMSSTVGQNLKSMLGITASSPQSAILLIDLIKLCTEKLGQLNKKYEQSTSQNNIIEMLVVEKDPYKFVTSEEMPKALSELLENRFYICFVENKIDVVFENTQGIRCSFQSVLTINNTGLGVETDELGYRKLIILVDLIKHISTGNFVEHEEQNLEVSELRI